MKIVSVTAGYASARFNKHMAAQPLDGTGDGPLADRVARSEAHFDSRVFSLPDEGRSGLKTSQERNTPRVRPLPLAGSLVDYFCWRALMDCRRNSISMLAQAHFPPKQLNGVAAQRVLQMLREEKQVEWEDEPAFFRFGARPRTVSPPTPPGVIFRTPPTVLFPASQDPT